MEELPNIHAGGRGLAGEARHSCIPWCYISEEWRVSSKSKNWGTFRKTRLKEISVQGRKDGETPGDYSLNYPNQHLFFSPQPTLTYFHPPQHPHHLYLAHQPHFFPSTTITPGLSSLSPAITFLYSPLLTVFPLFAPSLWPFALLHSQGVPSPHTFTQRHSLPLFFCLSLLSNTEVLVIGSGDGGVPVSVLLLVFGKWWVLVLMCFFQL